MINDSNQNYNKASSSRPPVVQFDNNGKMTYGELQTGASGNQNQQKFNIKDENQSVNENNAYFDLISN